MLITYHSDPLLMYMTSPHDVGLARSARRFIPLSIGLGSLHDVQKGRRVRRRHIPSTTTTFRFVSTPAIRINPYISEVWFDLGSLDDGFNNQITDAIDAYARASELDQLDYPPVSP